MMYLGKDAVGINTQFNIPPFFNHLLSGNFIVENNDTEITIPVNGINDPKGILIFSKTLYDLMSNKTDKQMLGAYAALYIRDSQGPTMWGQRQILSSTSFYFVNWGSSGSDRYPAQRSSRTENRGLRYFNTATSEIEINGFGTGEYDFKRNITYNWIAWD